MKKGSIIAEIQTERHKYHMVREQGQKKLAVPVALTSACLPRDYISTIQLGGDLKKERKKLLRKTSMAEKRSAVSTLFQLPSAFQEPSGPCLLFLIGLLARIADYIIQHSALPILILKGVQEVPPPLLTLLGLLNGPDEIPTGSRTAIKRPSYISAIVPLGSSAPSYDLVDYIGGRIHFDLAGKWRCWLPLTCHTMAVAPSVPRRVSDSIITQSPLAIPVVCHLLGKKPDRPIIELEGSHFLSYDPELLSQFQEATPLIHALLTEFFVWLLDKQKRMDKLWEASDNFRPSLRNGRFVSRDNSYQATLYSHGLAIFKLLLQYASDKKGWITNEAANDYLLRMWQVILPESAPTSKKADFPWDDRNTFWIFLELYLREHEGFITKPGMSRKATTVAAIHDLPDGRYLIFPRQRLLAKYRSWLENNHENTLPEKETKIIGAMLSWGLNIKTEQDDLSWRYSFYDRGQAPEGEKEKQPCLAIPVSQLPSAIAELLAAQFGDGFGLTCSSAETIDCPNQNFAEGCA